MTKNVFDIAVIPGDGIGPEVISSALEIFKAATKNVNSKFNFEHIELGAKHYRDTGEVLEDSQLQKIAQKDAILLGAIGDPSVPPGILERDLLLKLRFELDHYVNLRPSHLYQAQQSPLKDPGEIDFVVVREGTEGPYVGNGGVIRAGTDAEIATEVSLNTAFGVKRLVEYAFYLASTREAKKLTFVHKKNVLTHAGKLWQRYVDQVHQKYPDIDVNYLHIDAATIFMVTKPSAFDVIVTDNLFGDILTDLAGAVTGGIGLAASANINPDRQFPSMFEPVHGSAPDIAESAIADPTAAILSAAMMLEFLGQDDQELTQAADNIKAAVDKSISARDLNTTVETDEITKDIVRIVENDYNQ